MRNRTLHMGVAEQMCGAINISTSNYYHYVHFFGFEDNRKCIAQFKRSILNACTYEI